MELSLDSALKPWTGETLHVDRRIVFHKATKHSTAFAPSAARGQAGLVLNSRKGGLGTMAAFPAVPDHFYGDLGWKSITRIGPGLVNPGNACYVATVLQVPQLTLFFSSSVCIWQLFINVFCCLQCLTHVSPLVQFLGRGGHRECARKDACVACALADFVKAYTANTSGAAMSIATMTSKLKEIGSQFRLGTQQDPHEFLIAILHACHRGELKARGLHDGDARKNVDATFVYNIFGGYLRSEVTCVLQLLPAVRPFLMTCCLRCLQVCRVQRSQREA